MKLHRLLILLLFLLSLCWFCGCKNSSSPADSSGPTTKTQETSAGEQDSGAGEETAQKPQTYLGNDTLTFTYSEADYRALESEIDQWYRLFEAGNDPDGFLELYEQMEEGSFSKLDDQKTVAYILFSLDLQNESVKQQYLEMEKRATAASRRICALYDDINDSAYKDSFFAEWSDEDIRHALKSAKASTDEFEQLSNAYTELTVTYAALPDDANYLSASAQLYMQAISLNKQMAQLMGYDNYMDYAYDYVYHREYTPDDVNSILSLIQQTGFLDATTTGLFSALGNLQDGMSKEETENVLPYLMHPPVISEDFNGTAPSSEHITAYLQRVSPNFLSAYNQLFKDGNYALAFNDASREGAFTAYLSGAGHPVCYFGGSAYQSATTLLHEFGHYYAIDKMGSEQFSLDLSEVHSQGNEWLYAVYLGTETLTSRSAAYYFDYKLLMDITSFYLCLCINDFELYVYTHDNYTASDLDKIFLDICTSYGVSEFLLDMMGEGLISYWHRVTLENPGYYISYAMSLLPSIEIACIATENMDTAINAYLCLSDVSPDTDFTTALHTAGLHTPFDKEIYTRISGTIAKFRRLIR